MSYLRCLCLFVVYRCPTRVVLCCCFACLRLMYPVLPVSMDCPFFIAPSVFSNVQLNQLMGPHPLVLLYLQKFLLYHH